MDVKIHGNNLKVTEALQEYAIQKLNRLDRYLPNITDIWLELTHENTARSGDAMTAQITLRHRRGAILRAEERIKGTDPQIAINQAVDKMYRQIERFKGKRDRKGRERFIATLEELEIAEETPEETTQQKQNTAPTLDGFYEYQIVRRKQIPVTPMTEMEAVEQMELLGHDFFMFYNTETSGVNVLYRRKIGGYGVLVPDSEY